MEQVTSFMPSSMLANKINLSAVTSTSLAGNSLLRTLSLWSGCQTTTECKFCGVRYQEISAVVVGEIFPPKSPSKESM